MGDGRTDGLEYLLLGNASTRKKKRGLLFRRTAKAAILSESKNLPPIVACTENKVTEKCHKEGYVEQRAYVDLLRKPAVHIRCYEFLATFNVTFDVFIFML